MEVKIVQLFSCAYIDGEEGMCVIQVNEECSHNSIQLNQGK